MVDLMGASAYIYGATTIVAIIVALILSVPAGNLADKIGRKKTFFILAPFTWAGILLMLVVGPNPNYLILVAILGFIIGGGSVSGYGIGGVSFTPFITMWWESIPREKRGRGFGLEGLITSGAAIPASIIAGILWDQGFKTLVLAVPVLLEAIFVIPLLATVPDTKT